MGPVTDGCYDICGRRSELMVDKGGTHLEIVEMEGCDGFLGLDQLVGPLTELRLAEFE